jgi:hypothetical protein
MWAWDVENLGAGSVERNIVVPITMPRRGRNLRQQKITMIPFAVGRKKGSKKKTIALEDIQDIVLVGGN